MSCSRENPAYHVQGFRAPMQFYDLIEEDPFSPSVYFETRREALCGFQCLNNFLGGPYFTRIDIEKAVHSLLDEDRGEVPEDRMTPLEFYFWRAWWVIQSKAVAAYGRTVLGNGDAAADHQAEAGDSCGNSIVYYNSIV